MVVENYLAFVRVFKNNSVIRQVWNYFEGQDIRHGRGTHGICASGHFGVFHYTDDDTHFSICFLKQFCDRRYKKRWRWRFNLLEFEFHSPKRWQLFVVYIDRLYPCSTYTLMPRDYAYDDLVQLLIPVGLQYPGGKRIQ